ARRLPDQGSRGGCPTTWVLMSNCARIQQSELLADDIQLRMQQNGPVDRPVVSLRLIQQKAK
ncbi:MAG TPA: hypothetical protein PKA41_05970, partial [Verrucomicrobiota bacterium]|nr:hypothetical protein [Verrucomicrobiota bacterium]